MPIRNISGNIAKVVENVRAASAINSPALQDVVKRSNCSLKENYESLKLLPPEKKKSYLQHLEFLNPSNKGQSLANVAKISNQNLLNLTGVVDRIPMSSDWKLSDEDDLRSRIEDLQLVLRHGSISPELILDSGSIYSRYKLELAGHQVPGMMKKTGDSKYRYEDFVFFHLDLALKGEEVKPSARCFSFLLQGDLERQCCIFLRDCFSNMNRNILGEESSSLGRPRKFSFGGVDCYIETNHGRFRWRAFDENQKEIYATNFISNTEQFFFGKEDITSALLLTAILSSRTFGRQYLLDLPNQEFADKLASNISFEVRVPNAISVDKAIHCNKKPSDKFTLKERSSILAKKKKEVDNYNGVVYD